jgi:hypothetical protein
MCRRRLCVSPPPLCVAAAFVCRRRLEGGEEEENEKDVCRRRLCVSPPPLCVAAAFVCRRRLCVSPPPLCAAAAFKEEKKRRTKKTCVAAAFVCRRRICVSPPPLCVAAALVCRRRLCVSPPPLCERAPPRHLERFPQGIAFWGTLATYCSYILCFPQGPLPLILCAPCQTFLQRPLGVNSNKNLSPQMVPAGSQSRFSRSRGMFFIWVWPLGDVKKYFRAHLSKTPEKAKPELASLDQV